MIAMMLITTMAVFVALLVLQDTDEEKTPDQIVEEGKREFVRQTANNMLHTA